MSDESGLGQNARRMPPGPPLPDRRPDEMWGGPGAGAPCAICGAQVTPDEVEYELEFARDGEDPGRDIYHVHVRCVAGRWSDPRPGRS